MFDSPAGGATGLFQSPASGFVSPAAQIADGELVIEQVNQLMAQFAMKHPLIGPGELPQERVAGLVTYLTGKASNTPWKLSASGLAAVLIQDGVKSAKEPSRAGLEANNKANMATIGNERIAAIKPIST